jgi:UDPglucose 6-dehydrogenase
MSSCTSSSASRRIGVVGAGYVGLTTAACLAHLGHQVNCVDVDHHKIQRLNRGEVSIDEPQLADLVTTWLRHDRLCFHTELRSLADADTVLLCLPTPAGQQGDADLTAIESVLTQLSTLLARGTILVTKSTVPVGTAHRAGQLLARPDIAIVSNPEFLREGHAVHDFLHPDRIVLGATDPAAARTVAQLYQTLPAPVITTSTASAELAKYASNAFLALKISYANELAELCERLHADITEVTETMGLDHRIGPAFLAPGPGWGGSCLPKDTTALLHAAHSVDLEFGILGEAIHTNTAQPDRIIDKIRHATAHPLTGTRIGLLGLTFKAGTNDLRHSPALTIAHRLAAEGAHLTAYDPHLSAPGPTQLHPIHLVDDAYLATKDAEAIVVLTEAPQFRELDWTQIAATTPAATVIDTRNTLDPDTLRSCGLRHIGTGTPLTSSVTRARPKAGL